MADEKLRRPIATEVASAEAADFEYSRLTLADFLLARIAEDEADARGAGGEEWWATLVTKGRSTDDPNWVVDSQPVIIAAEVTDGSKAIHIVNHDPARVLVECEAKRQIVAEHAPEDRGNNLQLCRTCDWNGGDGYPCQTLVTMTIPYRDHPDYREEWAL